MKRYFITMAFGLALAFPLLAKPNQQVTGIDQTMRQTFDFAQHDMLFEGKRYRLFLAAPKQAVHEKLPVLYLLDGNAQFPMAVNLLKNSQKRPLVVGIGYVSEQAYDLPQRKRDYTFSLKDHASEQDNEAADFLRFIRTQVKPYIARQYAVDPHAQHFFGHSFGGLFGWYVLLHQPDLFQYYTLASPSLWWENGAVIPVHTPWLAKIPAQVQITLGEYEESPERDPKMTADRQRKIHHRQHAMPTRTFARLLAEQGNHVQFYLLPAQDHGGSISPAIEQAIKQLPK